MQTQGSKEKADDPILSSKRQETEKETSMGKGPKVPVRQESQINRSAPVSGKGNANRNPLAILALTRMPTLQIQKWMQMRETCAFKHTSNAVKKNGNADVAINLQETRSELCVKKSQRDIFSVRSIVKTIGLAPTKEAFQSAILSQCRKTFP